MGSYLPIRQTALTQAHRTGKGEKFSLVVTVINLYHPCWFPPAVKSSQICPLGIFPPVSSCDSVWGRTALADATCFWLLPMMKTLPASVLSRECCPVASVSEGSVTTCIRSGVP